MKDYDVKKIKDYLVNDMLCKDEKSACSITAQALSLCLIDGVLYYIDWHCGNLKSYGPPSFEFQNLIITENHRGLCAVLLTLWNSLSFTDRS